MGLLRLYLALSVVFWHLLSGVRGPMMSGYGAVTLFYMISGFYMSLVLTGRYRDLPLWDFYRSRLLRIYPLYWIVLAATVALLLLHPVGFSLPQVIRDNPLAPTNFGGWMALALANISLMGLELHPNQNRFVVVAWSLSIEVYFYLLAPFILKRSVRTVATALAILVLLRLSIGSNVVLMVNLGASLCFFFLGAVAHRLSERVSEAVLKRIGMASAFVLPVLGYVCGVQQIGNVDRPEFWVFYLAFAIALPGIFALSKRWKWDAAIGELSYPIYVVHMLVIGAIWPMFSKPILGAPPGETAMQVVAVVVALAGLLYLGVQKPIDRLRHRQVREDMAQG